MTVLTALALLLLCACGVAPESSVNDTAATAVQETETASGLPTYSFPKSYAWFLGNADYAPLGTSTDPVASGEFPIAEQYAETAVVQGNRINLTATDEQRDALVAQTDLLLSQAVDAWMNLNAEYMFQNAEDYSSMTFSMDESYLSTDIDHQIEESNLILTILYMVHANHILLTGDSSITTQVQITNYHSEKVAQEFSYPAQTLDFAAIKWDETY